MAKAKMPTAADIVAMWHSSGLKEKLIFTFLMIAVFRLGTHIPIYGINLAALASMGNQELLGFLDLFSGGALSKVSIFALGIGPYITASIIMQLLSSIIPHFENLQKQEGEAGRRKLAQYTRVFSVVLALFQSTAFMLFIANQNGVLASGVSKPLFITESALAITAGSILIMWIAELITERGIGNGASLLIFVGILSRIPYYASTTWKVVADDPAKQFALFILLIIFAATIFLIVIMQEAIRKVIIINAKKQVGNKVYGGVNTYIPFKLNPGGVMPIIFTVAIMIFPKTIFNAIASSNLKDSFIGSISSFMNNTLFAPDKIYYYIIYFALIVVLTFFYASIIPSMQPKEIANNLKKYGSSIPGIKPGKPTADLIDKILTRTTFIGALGLGIIALIPSLATLLTDIHTLQGLGATALIIMVGVGLDFINQIKVHLLARQYEGFLK